MSVAGVSAKCSASLAVWESEPEKLKGSIVYHWFFAQLYYMFS